MYYGISTAPVATLLAKSIKVNDLGDGASTLVRVDSGQVLSCQPDGTIELRPAGADGPYERCVVKDGCAVFNPQGQDGQGYVFALKAVPNA